MLTHAALVVNHTTVGVLLPLAVIVGVVILHVVCVLYLVQLFDTSTVPLSNLFPFGLNVALTHKLVIAYHVLLFNADVNVNFFVLVL